MKKYITTVLIGLFALTPVFASAQTVDSDQYRATLINLIGLLEQEVQLLQQELALTASETTSTDTTASSTDQISTGDNSGDNSQQGDTMNDMTLNCTLEIGAEQTTAIRQQDGSYIYVPNGTFEMTWAFDDGATGTLTSDNNDSGTFTESTGSRQINTMTTANYTLTVSKPGYEDAVCTASATHQQ